MLEVRLPADTGAQWDIVALESFVVSYGRSSVAREGRLAFDSAAGPERRRPAVAGRGGLPGRGQRRDPGRAG